MVHNYFAVVQASCFSFSSYLKDIPEECPSSVINSIADPLLKIKSKLQKNYHLQQSTFLEEEETLLIPPKEEIPFNWLSNICLQLIISKMSRSVNKT